MADILTQRLMPEERMLWRQSPTAGSIPAVWGTATVGAMTLAAMDPRQGALTVFLLVLLVLASGRSLALNRAGQYASVAVTNERLLFAFHFIGEEFEDGSQVSSITLRWIRQIEVLPRALRLTMSDGRVHVLEPLGDPAAVGVALARSARLSRPWVPSLKERLALEAVVFVAFAGAALAYALAFAGVEPAAAEAGRLAVLSVKLPFALAAGFGGCALGILVGILMVKPYLTHGEMRAWMRQCLFFAPPPEPGAKTHLFARFCLHFVDLIYNPPSTAAPEEPNER